MNRLNVFLRNLMGLPNRILAAHLRRRKWVVFYLEPKDRVCNGDTCWMKLYESEMNK